MRPSRLPLLHTYLALFRKIDFYLVLEDKSSPYNIFTIWNLSRRGSRENPDRFTDNRAPKAQESRGVRGHAPRKIFSILIA